MTIKKFLGGLDKMKVYDTLYLILHGQSFGAANSRTFLRGARCFASACIAVIYGGVSGTYRKQKNV